MQSISQHRILVTEIQMQLQGSTTINPLLNLESWQETKENTSCGFSLFAVHSWALNKEMNMIWRYKVKYSLTYVPIPGSCCAHRFVWKCIHQGGKVLLSAEVFFLLHMKRSQAAQQPPEHSADPPEVNREVKVVMTENIRGNTFLLSTSSKNSECISC